MKVFTCTLKYSHSLSMQYSLPFCVTSGLSVQLDRVLLVFLFDQHHCWPIWCHLWLWPLSNQMDPHCEGESLSNESINSKPTQIRYSQLNYYKNSGVILKSVKYCVMNVNLIIIKLNARWYYSSFTVFRLLYWILQWAVLALVDFPCSW